VRWLEAQPRPLAARPACSAGAATAADAASDIGALAVCGDRCNLFESPLRGKLMPAKILAAADMIGAQ